MQKNLVINVKFLHHILDLFTIPSLLESYSYSCDYPNQRQSLLLVLRQSLDFYKKKFNWSSERLTSFVVD